MSKNRRRPETTPAAVITISAPEGAPAPEVKPESAPTPDAGLAPVWKILGGVIVGVIALLVVMVYQQTQSQIRGLRNEVRVLTHDLRKELVRIGENHGAMIKKDDHATRLRLVWDYIKALQSDCQDLTRLRERCLLLADAGKSAEEDRKQLTDEVRRLREKQAADSERQALTREINAMREKIAAIEGKSKVRAVSATGSSEEQSKD